MNREVEVMGSNRYIRDLIREDEHQRLDFKYAVTDSRKIARTLVAFANTDGGRLLVGVKDNGRIAGIRSDEEMYMIETAAIIFCKPEVRFTTNVHETDGKTVLEIFVPAAAGCPYRAPDDHGRWHAYVRVRDENHIADRVLVRTWQRQKRKRGSWMTYSRPEQVLMDYLTDHDFISLSRFRKIARISHASAENILVNFLTWDILEPLFTNQGIRYKLKNVDW